MNVLMICSSRENIDPYYISIARSVAQYLAQSECDLVFGGCSSSMMGICYEEFVKNGRNIYSFTTKKYADDLINLKDSKHYIRETTFDLKKDMFLNSDLVVCLPGGPGTISELLSYIEEKRSNDSEIPIIIYDENGFYNNFMKVLNDLIKEKFVDENILNMFKVTTNKNEFNFLFIPSIVRHGFFAINI